jgi:hypothetical protein
MLTFCRYTYLFNTSLHQLLTPILAQINTLHHKSHIRPYLHPHHLHFPYLKSSNNRARKCPTAKMVQENDVIAIIIVVLFFILTLIAFAIYRLVSIARGSVISSSSGSGSGSSRSLVDD